MTHLPIELAIARKTAETAWKLHQSICDTGTKEQTADAAIKASELDNKSHKWYTRWQALGGTSDISSIVKAENGNIATDHPVNFAEQPDEAAQQTAEYKEPEFGSREWFAAAKEINPNASV